MPNAPEAFEIANPYRRRWAIEQLFRAMKTQGFGIERLRIEEEALVMAISIAAVVVQQLVHSREGAGEQGSLRPGTGAFEPDERPLLEAFSTKLEGKMQKQKNPHPKGSLAYASWACTRLGGWNCYYGKPGPITMLTAGASSKPQNKGSPCSKGPLTMCESDSPLRERAVTKDAILSMACYTTPSRQPLGARMETMKITEAMRAETRWIPNLT